MALGRSGVRSPSAPPFLSRGKESCGPIFIVGGACKRRYPCLSALYRNDLEKVSSLFTARICHGDKHLVLMALAVDARHCCSGRELKKSLSTVQSAGLRTIK